MPKIGHISSHVLNSKAPKMCLQPASLSRLPLPVGLWMPSSGSLTTDSDTVGEWLALLPPRVRGAHQSGREARQSDRCEMADDTKDAVLWPETAARLSQPGLLNDRSDFLAAVRFPGGMAAWQEDACTPSTLHALFIRIFWSVSFFMTR